MRYHVLACAALLAPAASYGQATVPAIAAPMTSSAMLRAGTEVPLKLSEELTTKGKLVKIGQRIRMETAENVIVQGVTVIPAGSPAMGEVTDVRNKGMWGKSGHINARVLYVTVNGRQIRTSGSFDDKGVAGGVGAVAMSAIVFAPAGFFMTGTSAKLPVGMPVKGFIDEDVQLAFAAAPMAPMAVAAPAVAAAPTTTVAAPVSATATAQPAVMQTVSTTPQLK